MDNAVMQVKIEEHEQKLADHDRRIDKIEQDSVEFKTEIKHLCENLRSLTRTMWWFMGLLIASFISFFFYAVQQHILPY